MSTPDLTLDFAIVRIDRRTGEEWISAGVVADVSALALAQAREDDRFGFRHELRAWQPGWRVGMWLREAEAPASLPAEPPAAPRSRLLADPEYAALDRRLREIHGKLLETGLHFSEDQVAAFQSEDAEISAALQAIAERLAGERRTNIEKVAGIIAGSGLSPESVHEINAGSGWSFDVRYPDQEYAGESFTRVEGLDLSPGDLAEALRVAAAWEAGDFEEKAR